jgi:1-acyl-sn-glycerol-3-phosphate acyltransferase
MSQTKNNPIQQLIRYLFAWIFMFVYWPIVLSFHLVTFKQMPDSWLKAAIRFWGRSIFKILGIRIHQVNHSTVETTEARVVICNHQSTLDLPWGGAICPARPVTIGKKEVIYIPILNLIFWALDFIRVDRGNTQKALASLEGVAEQIKTGRKSLVIAPEGTRSPTGDVLPFKKGAFHIAVQAQVPIHPVIVHGAFECLPKHRWLPRRGDLYIQFLEPISTLGKSAADVPALTLQAENAVREGLTTLRARFPISLD